MAWSQIYANSRAQTALATLRTLFPAEDDDIEEWQFSKLHKIILGIIGEDLAIVLACNGANIEIDAGDSDGTTPLMWAARRGDSVAVYLFLKNKADPNMCNRYLQSALLIAVRSSSFKCIRLLLEAGADPAQKDRYQFNALHYAGLYCNDAEIVQCLIEAGTEVDGTDSQGATPLFLATYRDNATSAHTLLANHAVVEVIDNKGNSALYDALSYHSHETFQMLLEHGASYTLPSRLGGSILHMAARLGDTKILRIMHAIGLKNIDPDALDRNGKNPLQRAQEREDAPEGFIDQMQELLTGIRVRNASLSRHGGAASKENIGGSADRDQPIAISLSSLAAPFSYPLQEISRIRSIPWPTRKSILLYWLLGLGWVGFVYKLVEPGPAKKGKQPS